MKYNKTLLAMVLAGSVAHAYAEEEKVWISIGSDAVQTVTRSGAMPILPNTLASSSEVWVGQVDSSQLAALSHEMHEEHHRCGGYMVHA